MKHSIFKKMLAIYLLVSVSAMILLGLLAAILIARIEADNNEAFLREKLQTFRSMGTLVEGGELTLAQYKNQVDKMGAQQGYTAYLLPTELGRLQIDSLLEKLSDKNLLNRLPKNILDGILSGEDVVFDGRSGSAQVAVLAGPAVSAGGKDYSLVLVKTSKTAVTGQTYLLWGLCAAFLVLTAAAAAVLSFAVRKTTRPLVQISRVCEAVAAGDYSQKVDIRAKDETGVIADSVNRMVERLQQMNTAQNDFSANISHELRTPLTIIRANLQAMRDGIIPAREQQEFMGTALLQTLRMERLVNELIDMASIDNSDFVIEPADGDFGRTLGEAAALARGPCLSKGICFSAETGSFQASCDHHRMSQVLANLLENAIRHTPEGGEITLGCAQVKGSLQVFVENTGPHITEKDPDIVFEKRFKGNGSKGSGLGLYLCRAIIEAHGGEIRAENTKKGVKISFNIPA